MKNPYIGSLIACAILFLFAIGVYAFVNSAVEKKDTVGTVAPTTNSTATSGNDSASTNNQQTASQTQTPSNCISPIVAVNDEDNNKTECVQFSVGRAYVSDAGNAYLDEYNDSSNYGFIVWMPSSDSFGSSATNKYANQIVDVTGTITQYDGAPEIEVSNASQIQLAQ